MDKETWLSIYGQGNCSLSLHWEFLDIITENGLSENDHFLWQKLTAKVNLDYWKLAFM